MGWTSAVVMLRVVFGFMIRILEGVDGGDAISIWMLRERVVLLLKTLV